MGHRILSSLTKGFAALSVFTLMGGLAFADHPTAGQMKTVKKLAHQLEKQAEETHETAERYAHHGGSAEKNAVKALHKFHDSAKHFHKIVEDNFSSPRHTENDYRKLNRRFYDVRVTFWGLHAFEKLRSDF